VGWWFQCGHCKNLKPVYEKVALAFKNEKNVSRDFLIVTLGYTLLIV
jgi:hypothetical protein